MATHTWKRSIDNTSNMKISGIDIILEKPNDLLIKKSLKFEFKAINNWVEYETLIVNMVFSLGMNASGFKSRSDSKLVANKLVEKYSTKEPQVIKYLKNRLQFM